MPLSLVPTVDLPRHLPPDVDVIFPIRSGESHMHMEGV